MSVGPVSPQKILVQINIIIRRENILNIGISIEYK